MGKFLSSLKRANHYMKIVGDLWLLRSSGLFDKDWYLAKNPDVANAKVDPVSHYLHHGGFEGRDPGPNFSSKLTAPYKQDKKRKPWIRLDR